MISPGPTEPRMAGRLAGGRADPVQCKSAAELIIQTGYLPSTRWGLDFGKALLLISMFFSVSFFDFFIQINDYLRYLAKRYPDTVRTNSIGKTFENRDILAITVRVPLFIKFCWTLFKTLNLKKVLN